ALTALALTAGVWPVRSQTPTADRGQAIFNENCAGCHGATAEGRSAPDLTSARWHLDHSDAQIDAIIRDGIPNTGMPAFGDRISADDRQAIVHLLRDLSSKSIQPATSVVAPPVHVEPARLLAAVKDPDNWLLYAGDYGQRRYSALASINRSTVKNLV